jgi:hypothetical protein
VFAWQTAWHELGRRENCIPAQLEPITPEEMIWLEEGSAQRLLYEIRRADIGEGFELHLIYPDGRHVIERFEDSSHLLKGSQDIQNRLRAEGWSPHLTGAMRRPVF